MHSVSGKSCESSVSTFIAGWVTQATITHAGYHRYYNLTKAWILGKLGIIWFIAVRVRDEARWLSGRVFDSRSRGCGFEPHLMTKLCPCLRHYIP